MRVHLVPVLRDNYAYILEDPDTKEAAAVDPVNADLVLRKINELGLKLTTILATHSHYDHSGGNADLVSKFKEGKLEVCGGYERVQAVTRIVKQDEVIRIGGIEVTCHETPCHTSGHICYYANKPGSGLDPCVFTGDTLFQAGCGKFFEGTASQMYDALKKLSKLPDNTKVYCGHEYTVNNLRFALSVEPANQDTLSRMEWAKNQRANNQPTIPSTIGEEKKFNPFMRVNEPSVQKAVSQTDPVATMKALRDQKDLFR